MKKILILLVLLYCFLNVAKAQQLPIYGQYRYNAFTYNPAVSGFRGQAAFTLSHRDQWKGVEGSPSTSLITFDDISRKKNIGYSAYLYSDRTGVLDRIGAYGSYAFKLKLTKEVKLSLGISAGLLNLGVNMNRVKASQKNDPNIKLYSQRKISFDANIGMVVSFFGLDIGISAPQLFLNTLEYAKNFNDTMAVFNLKRHYVAHLNYTKELIEKHKLLGELTFEPFVMVRYVPLNPIQYEGNVLINSDKLGWIGAGYKSSLGITASVGLNLTSQFSMGYVYEFPIDKALSHLGNTHEITLVYKFKKVKKEKEKRDGKSIARELQNQINKLKSSKNKLERKVKKLNKEKEEAMKLIKVNKDSINILSNLKGRSDTIVKLIKQGELATKADVTKRGYYLVAGVFQNKGNAIRLYEKIKAMNINVSYFYSKQKNYYYVFLRKFDNAQDAEAMKVSKLEGRYNEQLWVYDVIE